MSADNKKEVPVVTPPLRLVVMSVVLLLVVLATSCSKPPRDITKDPSYGNFKDAVGAWKTKVPLILGKNISDTRIYLLSTNRFMQGWRELATVPVGTEIRIERLTLWPSWECNEITPTGSLVAGAYAGHSLVLDGNIFFPRPGPTKSGLRDWTVLPENFEPSVPAAGVAK